ncbi:hypothetical protein LUZ60_005146 [Juncus effusus]|nr:hypothetical protein LUZ60_005146 [Juncus effusus]
MVEQVRNGMKLGQGFKNVTITAAVKVINNEFNVHVTETNVLNHYRTIKAKWNQIRRLKDMSGNGWDENEKIIMDEAGYNTYITAHPKDEPFINKRIEMYEEMSLVWGNDAATGQYAKSSHIASAPLGTPMEASPTPTPTNMNDIRLDNFDFFETGNNSMNDGSSLETLNVNSGTPIRRNSTSIINGKKKRKREEDPLLAQVAQDMCTLLGFERT